MRTGSLRGTRRGPAAPLFTSGSGTISDCDLSSVTVTEVYHSSTDIEVHKLGQFPM